MDKVIHFIIGPLIGIVWSLQGGIICGIIVGSIFGICKEIYDYFNPDDHSIEWSHSNIIICANTVVRDIPNSARLIHNQKNDWSQNFLQYKR